MPGMTAFPGAIDSFPEITAATPEDAPGAEHDVVHQNVHAAIKALEQKVGINGSSDATSLDRRLATLEAAGQTSYVHTQSSAASTWTINHNLGFIPSVELFTTGGAEFDAEVVHTNVNTTMVYLVAPLAGSARLS